MTIEQIARVAHSVNRAYCMGLGDTSQPYWENAPQWQRDSAINGVRFHLADERTPEESHNCWLAEKAEAGWVYGPVKDTDKKEHPCFVSYAELPQEQRIKDYLFKAVVEALAT